MIIKSAGWADGILAAGKILMKNNALKNAAIGAGVGAISGAMNSENGNRLAGAVKGATIGGVVGGVGTVGANINKTLSTNSGKTIADAAKDQMSNIVKSFKASKYVFNARQTLMNP